MNPRVAGKALGSLAPVERALREAMGDTAGQVGARAVIAAAHFWYEVLRVIADESRRQFHAQNQALLDGQLGERVRLLEGPVYQAIRELLQHPERFMKDWF